MRRFDRNEFAMPVRFEPVLLSWTVWRFRGPTSGEEVIRAYATEPVEHEHEYQKVVARVQAYNRADALRRVGVPCETAA